MTEGETFVAGEIGDGGSTILWTTLMASGMRHEEDIGVLLVRLVLLVGGVSVVAISVSMFGSKKGGHLAVAATEPFQRVSQQYW